MLINDYLEKNEKIGNIPLMGTFSTPAIDPSTCNFNWSAQRQGIVGRNTFSLHNELHVSYLKFSHGTSLFLKAVEEKVKYLYKQVVKICILEVT